VIEIVQIEPGADLDHYAEHAYLTSAVTHLRAEAQILAPRLRDRRVWMVNSTAKGGGVAEMLPKVVAMLRELGVDTQWAVIGTERTAFFDLTKRIHNLIHGAGEPELSASDRELYETVSEEVAAELAPHLHPQDILVVHDPQPAGMGASIKRKLGLEAVWRSHIGLDASLPQTEAAWGFLEPYVSTYDHAVFTAPEYIPPFLTAHVSIIRPAIDPLSHKNRDLSAHKLTGVLRNSDLSSGVHPVLTPDFDSLALRLQPDGTFGRATEPDDIGLLTRTIITQVSRWDGLKGWLPLIQAFERLKKNRAAHGHRLTPRERKRLEIVRLVLAGPEPAAIQDDPEAVQVLDEIIAACNALDPEIKKDVALLLLPMSSRKVNALMVNALQRCSSIVVQNSIREGFGLTVTEAMWKKAAIVGSNACGIRQQIRDGVDGRLVQDPSNPAEIEHLLVEVLSDAAGRTATGRSAQRRVYDELLVFAQVRKWIELLSSLGREPRPSSIPSLATT
jgi:trehalose synthase